ncbi:MAG: Na+/H+ antiporter NhaA [Acidimicrobiia bacterium]|nr:MAG: Na+/H+ antiporter NhaA [Acidimicrobiia bacterium]
MANDSERLHQTWLNSDRAIPRRFVRPALRFADTEAASGVVLLAAAVLALLWANSLWGESYFSFWGTKLTIELGSFHFEETLKDIVNDGLMAIFFFVVGLEIKRELVVGELNSMRKAALPAMAALGGMVVPALIYVAFVASSNGGDAIAGWGIPMATDIAFSVGVIALLGSRVPVGAKLFLLALAIVDDIGAILVIAVFYTADLSIIWLAVAAGALFLLFTARQAGIRSIAVYLPLALIVWFSFLESGVHATIAGVILGLMVPARAMYSDLEFRRRARWILERFDMNAASPDARERLDQDALELEAIARESVPPLERFEHRLHRFSSFIVVPLFALANAGIRFADLDVIAAIFSPIALGVSVGLVLGKPVGIALATWIGLRLKLGELPRNVRFSHVIAIGVLAGIGFTVSLFIAELAFRSSDMAVILTDEAKIGIFLGSAIAGIAGYFLMRRMTASPAEGAEAVETGSP